MKLHLILGFLIWITVQGSAQPAIEKAHQQYARQQWGKAFNSFKRLTAENPFHPDIWGKYCYAALKSGHYQESIRAGHKAMELGAFKHLIAYNIASSFALMGNEQEAMNWLQKSINYGNKSFDYMAKDESLSSLRQLPQFKKLISPEPAQFANRVEGWHNDLAVLKAKMEKEHKNMFHTLSKDAWESALNELHKAIPGLSDLEVIGEMMALVARVSDGHTVIYPPFEGQYAFSALPIELYHFNDGLFIRAAAPEYQHLVGTKVLAAGDLGVDDLVAKAQRFLNRDNSYQLKWMTPVALTFAELYQLLGISNGQQVTFTLQRPDGTVIIENVESGPLMRDPMTRFAPEYWTDMKGDRQALWTKNAADYYWFEYLQDQKVVYCQYNQVRNKDDQPLNEFTKSLSDFIDANDVRALVLDIRLNNGGNSFLNKDFVQTIIKNEKINQYGKFFTVIGRRTFSAAMNLASDLEQQTNTIFVGEPTGSRPNFYGEDNEFVLPYSGLVGSISSRYWQGGATSDDIRPWIAPYLAATLSSGAYKNGADPALEAILVYLGGK